MADPSAMTAVKSRVGVRSPAAGRPQERALMQSSAGVHRSGSPQSAHPLGAWHALVGEFLVALGGVILYFSVRGLMSQSAGTAVDNANAIMRFEMSLRMYWEPAWQGLIIDHQGLVTLANWAYIYLHWPVITVVAAWLYLCHRAEYVVFRNAFVISGAIGLVLFVLFPVAPPRLAELGLMDTITAHSNAYRVLQPPALVNQYAAFPSLHFGWNLLIGLAMYQNARWRIVKLLGLMLPAVMLFAIVATANHYLIDAVAGGVLSLSALALARWPNARASEHERLRMAGH